MKKYLSISFLLLMVCSKDFAESKADTIYTYYDSARNKYVFKNCELNYMPITAKESSSGIYNGGSKIRKILRVENCQKLVQLFINANADKNAQTKKNIKPNTAVEIIIKKKKTNFLLKHNADANISLHNYLNQILKN